MARTRTLGNNELPWCNEEILPDGLPAELPWSWKPITIPSVWRRSWAGEIFAGEQLRLRSREPIGTHLKILSRGRPLDGHELQDLRIQASITKRTMCLRER